MHCIGVSIAEMASGFPVMARSSSDITIWFGCTFFLADLVLGYVVNVIESVDCFMSKDPFVEEVEVAFHQQYCSQLVNQ
jgi:hypothetical protein